MRSSDRRLSAAFVTCSCWYAVISASTSGGGISNPPAIGAPTKDNMGSITDAIRSVESAGQSMESASLRDCSAPAEPS